MSLFRLPDLGEGLREAEIAEWLVRVGDRVEAGQPLLAVETDKAIVEIPSPRAGRIARLWGEPGTLLEVGAQLVEFDDEPVAESERVAGTEAVADTERVAGTESVAGTPAAEAAEAPRTAASRAEASRAEAPGADAGTVVGRMPASGRAARPAPTTAGDSAGIKTTPAVRALAKRLDVDLAIVTPSGRDDTITNADVERVARILAEAGPLEPLRGVRRAMARTLSRAHVEVVPVTVVDDADVESWASGEDVMLRLIRAIVVACGAEPSLNAWFDGHSLGRRLLAKIDLGVAVDTPDGLFVPVLRDVGHRAPPDLRRGLEAMKSDLRSRSVLPEDLRGHTFTLSNFGSMGGRYADPIVVPPTVAILGAGRLHQAVVAVDGRPAVHRVLPLSLTFDHRAVTGGEAVRFLSAAIGDLEHGQ
jgi:2-oxoisovalerate dehydrogenase E2 component (dihydrolipoyl transacylase)